MEVHPNTQNQNQPDWGYYVTTQYTKYYINRENRLINHLSIDMKLNELEQSS